LSYQALKAKQREIRRVLSGGLEQGLCKIGSSDPWCLVLKSLSPGC